jgi:hypothetical protein
MSTKKEIEKIQAKSGWFRKMYKISFVLTQQAVPLTAAATYSELNNRDPYLLFVNLDEITR